MIKSEWIFLILVSGKGNPSGIGDLDLDKTEIIVPKGMEKKVNVNGKTIDTKSEIQIGNIKVKSPSVQEMKDFLKKNFDLLKKVDPEEFVKIRKLETKLKEHESQLDESTSLDRTGTLLWNFDQCIIRLRFS